MVGGKFVALEAELVREELVRGDDLRFREVEAER